MNRDQLQKTVGKIVQLEPIACRLDEYGIELPLLNDDWRVREITAKGIKIDNLRTGHTTTLAFDHIHHFTSNPERSRASDQEYGFLSLHVQMYVRAREISFRPNLRPGERVDPPRVEILEKSVNIDYPVTSGIQQKLEGFGYKLQWCNEPRVAEKCEVEGWEVVIERDNNGALNKFRLKTRPHDQILLKQRVF